LSRLEKTLLVGMDVCTAAATAGLPPAAKVVGAPAQL
jgi:hypothetical protein